MSWRVIARRIFVRGILATSAVVVCPASDAAKPSVIDDVRIAQPFFNPSLGEKETVSLRVARGGEMRVTILDRDRLSVRALPRRNVKAGPVTVEWDGKDDAGELVPDEAYSLRIDLATSKGTSSYDPSKDFVPAIEKPTGLVFSPRLGVLNYRISKASRVNIQAGESLSTEASSNDGIILKTVVDHAPRPAGAVVENWDGRDESGTISVPQVPRFVFSILASTLPEGSIIAIGNRRINFREYALRHRSPTSLGVRLLKPGPVHRVGLNALEDYSPHLNLVTNPSPGPGSRGVVLARGPLRLRATFTDDARHFLAQAAELSIYLDEKLLRKDSKPTAPVEITIGPEDLSPGEHRLAVNWCSELGPTAVASMKITVQ